MQFKGTILVLFCLFAAYEVRGDEVFDLRDISIEAIDEAPSFQINQGGLIATVSANIGDLNRTGSGFGINAPGAGDDTDNVDAVNGLEIVSVSFNADVSVKGIFASLLGAADNGSLTIPGNAAIPFGSFGFVDAGGAFMAQGNQFDVAYVSGNGFSFDSFTVDRVPEPSALMLLGAAAGVLAWRRRRLA